MWPSSSRWALGVVGSGFLPAGHPEGLVVGGAPGVGGLPATDQSSGGPTDKGQVGSGFAAAAPWALPSLSMTGPFQGEVSIRFWSL